ncbi:hypothetical protein FACS1894188_01830 [Clostridia bacterium]|nr:hypothetical protein FACS1894188_01830 [Clostridia bacterium]
MKRQRKYYNAGSTARKVVPARKRRRKNRKVVLKRRPIEFRNEIDRGVRFGAEYYAYALLIALGLAAIFTINGKMEESKNAARTLRSNIKIVEEASRDLQASIARDYNEGEIQRLAKARLSMDEPKPYQIITISVATKNYVSGSSEAEVPAPQITELFTRQLSKAMAGR